MKKIIAFFLYILSITFITLLLDYHLFHSYLINKTFLFETGQFYPDMWFNLALYKTAAVKGINFFDPYNRVQPIFYQFFMFWLIGGLANIFRISPVTLINILLLFIPLLVSIIVIYLTKEISNKKFLPLLSIFIVFSFGNLAPFVTGLYQRNYGNHAVMMTFLQQFYGPYTDNFSLLFGFAGLIFLIKTTKKSSILNIAFFVFFASLCFLSHYLVALYFVSLYFVVFAANDYIFHKTPLLDKILSKWYFLVPLYLAFLYVFQFRLPLIIILLIGFLFFAYFFWVSSNKIYYSALIYLLFFLSYFWLSQIFLS